VKPDGPARASAKVDGSVVSVNVSISVEYPNPVVQIAGDVRKHITQQVSDICGLDVAEVHVEVPHFYSLHRVQPPRRVL
jgi:uncharacterized alkaline shock family protein YloU